MSRPAFLPLLLTLAFATLAPEVRCQEKSDSEVDARVAAQKLFEAGDALYESKRYEEASQAFRQSHSLVKSPNSRLMLARSLRELGHLEEAKTEFQGTIDDAAASFGRYPEAHKAATAELMALPSAAPQEADAKAPPHAPATPPPAQTPDTAPLAKPPALTSDEKKPRPLRIAAWASVGVATAGAVGFGVFGLLNRSTYKDLQASCPSGGCTSDPTSRVDRGETYQLFTNISLGVFSVGAIAATTLFLTSGSADKPQAALQISPGTLQFRGRF